MRIQSENVVVAKKRGPHAAHVLGTLETGFEVACCIWNIFIVVATSGDSVANGSKRLLKTLQ